MGSVDRSLIMRISISGTAGQGKTTLIESFIEKWDMYTTPTGSYRDLIKGDNHSKNTNKETQWNILNYMIDDIQTYSESDNVILDRCPLDNLIYSMWCYHKGVSDIDELFIEKCIPVVRESMTLLDIIFFIPLTNVTTEAKEDDTRETDSEYIGEIDNFFKAMHKNWMSGDTRFFPKEDRAALIEIFGTTEERISMIGLYLNDAGDEYGEDESLVDTNTLVDEFGMSMDAGDITRPTKEDVDSISRHKYE